MNYYERHIGDYARDTAHLSMLEHGAYSVLLDRYYMTERAIPTDEVFRLARARTAQERAAVSAVLQEFFHEYDDAWHHKYADRLIEKARTKIKAAQENGRLGGRPRGNPEAADRKPTGLPLGSDFVTQNKALQTPNTKHQENPLTPGKRGSVHGFPAGFEAFWAAYPRKTAKTKAAQAFARVKPDDALLAVMLAAIADQARWEQWVKDGGQFIPHPATWLTGRRWEDQPTMAAAKDDPFAGAA